MPEDGKGFSANIKAQLAAAGAEVRSGDELPAEVREAMDDLKGRKRGRRKVGVELKRLADGGVYVYEDEHLELCLPIPRVDVFDAFLNEFAKAAAPDAPPEHYTIQIARAFWVIHQKPPWWRKRKWCFRVDDDVALAFLHRRMPRADLIYKSLPAAFVGFIEYVMGKKKPESPASIAE